MFSENFLNLLNTWQWGQWTSLSRKVEIAQELKTEIVQCSALNIFRRCSSPCYRKINLNKILLTQLLVDGVLDEMVSSWTLTTDIAEDVGGGPAKYERSIIIQRLPVKNEVILNLEDLYKDPTFQESISRRTDLSAFSNINSDEHEVILEVPYITKEDIWGFGYYVDILGMQSILHEPEFQEKGIDEAFLMDQLRLQAITNNSTGWIKGHAAQNIIDNALINLKKRGYKTI